MSKTLDAAVSQSGTRFLLFAQPSYLPSFRKPEVVYVNVPPDRIKEGPQDDRLYVVDAIGKLPYQQGQLPPYRGAANAAVKASGGHFDHLRPGTRGFACATMYATVRRSLDIWEDYFGRRIEWHFRGRYDRMEMIPLIDWDNAQSGFGFLEFGFGRGQEGGIDYTSPYCENFDVLTHELGHAIIFSEVGVPSSDEAETADYGGFHESAGDLVAIVCSLHFNSVVSHLLEKTHGNLFSSNELARMGELSDAREIRIAFNDLRMSNVGKEPHERSQPLTGAVFDILVEVFQKNLVKKKMITQELADKANNGPGQGVAIGDLQRRFMDAHKGHKAEFKAALIDARDALGKLLAQAWSTIKPDNLTYYGVLHALLDADRKVANGANQDTIRDCFKWREIMPARRSVLLQRFRLDDCGMHARRVDTSQVDGRVATVKDLNGGHRRAKPTTSKQRLGNAGRTSYSTKAMH